MNEPPVFWVDDPAGGSLKSPFVRQPAYSLLQERMGKIERVISKLVPENERDNIGLSVGSLKALQRMVASQSDAASKPR